MGHPFFHPGQQIGRVDLIADDAGLQKHLLARRRVKRSKLALADGIPISQRRPQRIALGIVQAEVHPPGADAQGVDFIHAARSLPQALLQILENGQEIPVEDPVHLDHLVGHLADHVHGEPFAVIAAQHHAIGGVAAIKCDHVLHRFHRLISSPYLSFFLRFCLAFLFSFYLITNHWIRAETPYSAAQGKICCSASRLRDFPLPMA